MGMRVTFSEVLSHLEGSLQEEGVLVLRALSSSLNALARCDEELADELRRRGFVVRLVVFLGTRWRES